ncbi:Epsin-3, clathrin recruitment and traffic between the Golgi and endosome [Coemansia javaensis]|uniref:Epsin-3, clathrin recruitment and traffic between the Golgi and endosome n=1 Tax=Coemansia javaensis TaxID=2761396 RepID=A0A9W8HD95_9FUNG|nr:Epsin-3, clathrin recruitment and traffic between the Golgi and endosome [Coemansia javaensis]
MRTVHSALLLLLLLLLALGVRLPGVGAGGNTVPTDGDQYISDKDVNSGKRTTIAGGGGSGGDGAGTYKDRPPGKAVLFPDRSGFKAGGKPTGAGTGGPLFTPLPQYAAGATFAPAAQGQTVLPDTLKNNPPAVYYASLTRKQYPGAWGYGYYPIFPYPWWAYAPGSFSAATYFGAVYYKTISRFNPEYRNITMVNATNTPLIADVDLFGNKHNVSFADFNNGTIRIAPCGSSASSTTDLAAAPADCDPIVLDIKNGAVLAGNAVASVAGQITFFDLRLGAASAQLRTLTISSTGWRYRAGFIVGVTLAVPGLLLAGFVGRLLYRALKRAMDLSKVADISVWDVRNVYNKVKSVVMNYSEMEIKVNEATGPEPWGASSTLLRELADATHNRKDFEDIMAMAYLKLGDADPANWRQVYKALQLVEYLVKNGAERVVEDVRAHITVVRVLKSFHHIDAAGKDQGVNVRHRSKELVDLVNDRDRLRDERKKAKENRNKYGGFSGGARMDGFGSSSYRGGSGARGSLSGFGNNHSGSSSSGTGGGRGGRGAGSPFGGLSSSDYATSRFDDRPDGPYRSETDSTPSAATTTGIGSRRSTRQITPVGTREPEVADLLSFGNDDDDDDVSAGAAARATPAAGGLADPLSMPAPTPPAKPALPVDLLAMPAPAPPAKPALPADDDWGDFQGVSSDPPPPSFSQQPAAVDLLGGDEPSAAAQPVLAASPAASSAAAAAASAGPGQKSPAAFSDIWGASSALLSLDSLSLSKKPAASRPAQQGAPMNQLAGRTGGRP